MLLDHGSNVAVFRIGASPTLVPIRPRSCDRGGIRGTKVQKYFRTSVLPCESISLNYYHPTTPMGDTTSIQKLLHPTTPLLLINLAYLHFRTAKRKVAILADAIYLHNLRTNVCAIVLTSARCYSTPRAHPLNILSKLISSR